VQFDEIPSIAVQELHVGFTGSKYSKRRLLQTHYPVGLLGMNGNLHVMQLISEVQVEHCAGQSVQVLLSMNAVGSQRVQTFGEPKVHWAQFGSELLLQILQLIQPH
jgi:hypothetical protein